MRQFAGTRSQWSLEELVEIANRLLPMFLPDQQSGGRVLEEVNPRLVRHYSSAGLLEKPLKEGREARYTYRHLLQLLVGRRLLMEGHTANTIAGLIAGKDNGELESLLEGGVRLTVEAANPALAFLEDIRMRAARPPEAPPRPAASFHSSEMLSFSLPQSPPEEDEPQRWVRIEVLPGLDLHVREDFRVPSSAQERHNLVRLIGDKLSALIDKWRKP